MIRFVEREKKGDVSALCAKLGIEKASAQVLAGRGITTEEEARAFFSPGLNRLNDPFLFDGMSVAVERIEEAVEMGEPIAVFADYDADGTCAAAMLYRYFSSRGVMVDCYFPDRRKEGYGLNESAVRKIAQTEAMLLITADCGVTNVREAALAAELGLDVIILDHHECPETLPDAYAIIDPKMPGCGYPFRELCGAGVAFKLICALSGVKEGAKYIDLAALATIGDIVPLLGENRSIAAEGLNKMRQKPCAGISALIKASSLERASLTAHQAAFALVPRVNAGSRMDDARVAFNVLSAQSEDDKCRLGAKKLSELNESRKKEELEVAAEVESQITGLCDKFALVVGGGNYNPGVIGIVASRISRKYNRPAAVLAREGDNCVASMRGVEGVDIYEELCAHRDMFSKFGGHAQAAGFTLRASDVSKLEEELGAGFGARYEEGALIPQKRYDAQIDVSDINEKLLGELALFEPFGHANPQPVFLLRGLEAKKAQFVGKNVKSHMKFTLFDGGASIGAIAFCYTDDYAYVSRKNDYLVKLGVNSYDNKAEANVECVKPCDYRRVLADYVDSLSLRLDDGFFDHMLRLYKGQARAKSPDEKEPCALIDKSALGTAVVFDTVAGARHIYRDGGLKERFLSGGLDIYFDKSPIPFNAVAFAGDVEKKPGYKDIIYLEDGGEGTGLERIKSHPLFGDYSAQAGECFVGREGLLKLYAALKRQGGFSGDAAQALALLRESSLTQRQGIFGLRVLSEIGLLEYLVGDIIKCKMSESKGKRNLEDSETFRIVGAIKK